MSSENALTIKKRVTLQVLRENKSFRIFNKLNSVTCIRHNVTPSENKYKR